MTSAPEPGGGSGSGAASAAAQQVASIIEAAERTAEQIRAEAEKQVRQRIAEVQRAAENQVSAAEEEAEEILASAREEATRIRAEAKAEAEQAVAKATDQGLEIMGRAGDDAEQTRAEAAKEREETAWRAKELMRDASETAAGVDREAVHAVGNLRELGDSLRANAERLLKDVQTVHARMVAQIERVEAAAGTATPARRSPRDGAGRSAGSGAERSGRARRPSPSDGDDELDVPEFLPPG